MDFAEQLKGAVDIVSVVREYVPSLQKRGTRYVGLCPFHNEKTPSFGVHAAHQFYKCFGCGAGGDVIKFVMEIERLTFHEALKLLAERHGIPMPRQERYSDAESRLRGGLYELHEAAAQLFRAGLESTAGAGAREYLKRRGVSGAVAAEFGLGYAEPGGQALTGLLERRGATAEQMEACGLVIRRREGSGFFDRFRGRLMFPIHSESGKIIAFAGRALAAGDEPKYLNSPETEIYKKTFVLYNLHRAKKSIRNSDFSILVEGYMDVIGLHAAGVVEAVASCGTALTAQQVRTARRFSDKMIVNFDPDAAGANAAERSIQMLLEEGMRIRIVELEDGLDPDEYVKKRGADAYRARLKNAAGYFYWLADRARGRFDLRAAEGRVEALKFLLPAVQRLPDKLERAALAGDLASYIGVEPGLVLEQFRRAATERREQPAAPPARVPPVEHMLLAAVLEDGDARRQVLPRLQTIRSLEGFRTRRIFEAMFHLEASEASWDYQALEARLEGPERDLLASCALADQMNERDVSLAQAVACLNTLEARERETQLSELRARARAAEREGNEEEALRLTEELSRAMGS
ncbi:MAG: DNA primase [Bryobacteraceae bacterium]|nr:DNA primase [Bryobacteraceae bacterium]